MNLKDIISFNAPYNQQNVDSLIEGIKSQRIIPYIGAGMSILFEGVYPSWSGFLNSTFEQYIKIDEKAKYDSFSLEEKADFLYCKMGKITFGDHLIKTFGEEHLLRNAIDFVDKPVYLLPIIFENGLLITTNYDKVIEKIFTLHEKVITVAHPKHYESLNRALRESKLLLYKIHGDIAEPDTSIILTKEQYETKYTDPNLIQALSQAFMSKEMLFLGCSITKDRPIELLCQISQSGMKNYAIISCEGNAVDERRLQLENEYFTQAIIYPEGRHECLKVLLDYIAETINPQLYQRTMGRYLHENPSQTGKTWIRSDTRKGVSSNELIKCGDVVTQLDGNVVRAEVDMPDGKSIYAEFNIDRNEVSNVVIDGYPQAYSLDIPKNIIVNKQEGMIIIQGIEYRAEKYILKFGGYLNSIYDKVSGELQDISAKAPVGMTITVDETNKLLRIVAKSAVAVNVPKGRE
ncbi:SIR2 family NAD-dependent protein deacylase [Lachnoclostridium phytofermentans]|uniref:SIR2-like domain-containing protein n=1 Tax=Lachnoclostridium phytofermentans (strain ATCC 700394 / DSM 18823 / ISDg) TaxID=357809 RepID=A9KLI0_LACP7|nr:SIR2 family protein [Lachnoclostridium phytofermentans]ABX41309.1 hypothetical protein Cphy_0925 [Lachnoclostridium phytofermentans ISDg]